MLLKIFENVYTTVTKIYFSAYISSLTLTIKSNYTWIHKPNGWKKLAPSLEGTWDDPRSEKEVDT